MDQLDQDFAIVLKHRLGFRGKGNQVGLQARDNVFEAQGLDNGWKREP